MELDHLLPVAGISVGCHGDDQTLTFKGQGQLTLHWNECQHEFHRTKIRVIHTYNGIRSSSSCGRYFSRLSWR